MIELTMDEVKKAIFINVPPADHEFVRTIEGALPSDPKWIRLLNNTGGIIWWMLVAPTDVDFLQQTAALITYCISKKILVNVSWHKAQSTVVENAPPVVRRTSATLPFESSSSMPIQEKTPQVVSTESTSSTSKMMQSLQAPPVTSADPVAPSASEPPRQRKSIKEHKRRAIENDSLKRIKNELTELLEKPEDEHHRFLLFCLKGLNKIPNEKYKLLLLMANYLDVLHHGIPSSKELPAPALLITTRPATINVQPVQAQTPMHESLMLPLDREDRDAWESNFQGLEQNPYADWEEPSPKRGRLESHDGEPFSFSLL